MIADKLSYVQYYNVLYPYNTIISYNISVPNVLFIDTPYCPRSIGQQLANTFAKSFMNLYRIMSMFANTQTGLANVFVRRLPTPIS